jgi:predicted nucleic acid-binding protein
MSEIKLFLDSSALFSGIASAKGAARALLLLGEMEMITLVISEQVVTETERAIARKAPQALKDFREAILSSKAQIVRDPAPNEVKVNLHLVSHSADVPILLAAMKAQVDYLVTTNRKHFIDDPEVAQNAGMRIGTAGEALQWVKRQIPEDE